MNNYCIVCASSDCDVIKENEQLKKIIKTVFDYCESDVWRNSNHIMYTDEQKQIIIDILENNK